MRRFIGKKNCPDQSNQMPASMTREGICINYGEIQSSKTDQSFSIHKYEKKKTFILETKSAFYTRKSEY